MKRTTLLIALLSVGAWGQNAVQRQAVAGQFYHVTASVNTTPYLVAATDSHIACDATSGTIVLNLPVAAGIGREITIKKVDASTNACTLTRAGSDTIDGAATVSLTAQYSAVRLVDRAAGIWSRSHVNQLAGDVTGASTANVIASQHKTRTVAVSDLAPVSADSGLITVINPATAIHLTRMWCAIQGTTNVVLNLDKRAEVTIGTDSGAHLLGSDLTAVASGANTTTFANGSSQCGGTSSCAVAAHTPVVLTLSSVSGTPTALNCSVDYTVD